MLTRKTVILAKVESVYGQDPTPTPAANALLVKDVDLRVDGEMVERDFLRATLSPLEFVRGMKEIELAFSTELKGTGTAGSLPSWGWEGELLRACGFSETITPGVSIVYEPVSSSFEAVTLYLYMDGIFHKILGCRGTPVLTWERGRYANMRWTMRGLYAAPVDATPGAQTFSSVKPPVLLSAGITIGGYSPVATAVEIALNNALGRREDANSATGLKEILITGRAPGGSLNPETVTEATKAFWNEWELATAQAINIGPVGGTGGNQIQIAAPKAQYESIGYGDREGLLTYEIPLRLAQDTGDDELTITFT